MRFKVTFKTNKLPILYRHRFMALIKEALKTSNKDFKDCMYPSRDSEFSKRVKPFSFNISLPPGRTVRKESFLIDEGVEIEEKVFYFLPNSLLSIYISSSDYQFMINLYNGLLNLKEFKFNDDICLKLDRVFMLNEKKINTSEVVFKTNSPVLIEDEKGKPVLPLNDPTAPPLKSFNEHFNAIHDRILKDIRGGGLNRSIEFIPVNIKKQVVKHTLRGFREKTGKPFMTLTCFEGCFKLKGDTRDLQLLYQIGIGLRTGQGFGMVDMV
jgi:CRISPR-associated endoribonuclease Cas6